MKDEETMNPLATLHDKSDELAHDDEWRKPREYFRLMGDLPEQAEKELSELEAVGKKIRPYLLKIKSKPEYRSPETYPANVRRRVLQILDMVKAGLQTIEQNPGFLIKRIKNIREKCPADFDGWGPATLANEDKIALMPLFGSAEGLKGLPAVIESLEAEVERIASGMLARGDIPVPNRHHKTIKLPPKDTNEPDTFDPRE